jgi:thiol:disulfide interchange protein
MLGSRQNQLFNAGRNQWLMMRRARWLAVILLLGVAALARGQAPPTESVPGLPNSLNVLDQMNGLSAQPAENPVEFSGRFEIDPATRQGRLLIEAVIQPEWHMYSLTQPVGGPRRTVIKVTEAPGFQVTGPFTADRDPNRHDDPNFPGIVAEEHEFEVIWSAPITLAEGTDPDELTIEVRIDGQVCDTGGVCKPISGVKVTAAFSGSETPPPVDPEVVDIVPAEYVALTGYVEPKVAAPGGTVHVVIKATLTEPWHIYQVAEVRDPKKISLPTLIAWKKTLGWRYGQPQAQPAPVSQETGMKEEPVIFYHEGEVTFTVPFEVPPDAAAGTFSLSGVIGYQSCTPDRCNEPSGKEFEATVTIGPQPERGNVPLVFRGDMKYMSVAKLAEQAAAKAIADSAAKPVPTSAGTWSDKSLAVVLVLAFLAGLILNVMPCVLPVIGLKIMSFVQQAGGSRREIMTLNLWFSFGLLSVFWVLAGAAAFANKGWGDHFRSVEFLIAMIGIVFAFGLSFLGVWEIPIPGFVGSSKVQGAAAKEGAIGAFSKGVLSTILATPCAGPLLVPAVSWAVAQPAWLTFLAFTCIGLGMSTPYLLIGAFPRLISVLPRPGLWMDSFKQWMGFLLLGTVIFLFSSLQTKWVIPTLTLLLGIGIGCWWVGRTPAFAELPEKLSGWAGGLIITAISAAIGFIALVPGDQLPWIPYDRVTLEKHLDEGSVVLVDFTADW